MNEAQKRTDQDEVYITPLGDGTFRALFPDSTAQRIHPPLDGNGSLEGAYLFAQKLWKRLSERQSQNASE